MRLLTKKQITNKKTEEQNEIVARGLRVTKYTNEAIRNLNIMKDRQEKEVNAIRTKAKIEIDSLLGKRDVLLDEIEQLEKRQEQLMKPINNILLEAKKKKEEADIRFQDIENTEKLLDKKRELLTMEKSEVDYLRKEYETKLKKINKDEENILIRKHRLSDEEASLSRRKNEFKIYQDGQKEKIKRREEELSNQRSVVYATEEWCKNERIRLDKEQKHIVSQQEALKAAFKEAKSKNII